MIVVRGGFVVAAVCPGDPSWAMSVGEKGRF
jgi:hypothetical protein